MKSLFQKIILEGILIAIFLGSAEISSAEERKPHSIIKLDFIPDSCDFTRIKETGANLVTCRNDVYAAFLSDVNGDLQVDNILWYNGKEFLSLTRRGDYFKTIDKISKDEGVYFDFSGLQKKFIKTYREHNI